MLNKKKNNKGFTLVELLVVIAIIGILAVVAVPALFSNIEKSKVAKLEGNISAIKSAALSYYADHSEFYQTTGGVAGVQLTAEEISEKSGLSDYLEDLRPALNNEKYTITGQTTSATGSVLTIDISKSLGNKSIEKLVNDLGLTNKTVTTGATADFADTNQIKITIINKK